MTHCSETPSLDTLLGKMNEPEVPNGLADKIIAAAVKLPQDDTVASTQLASKHGTANPPIALQKNREHATKPNISRWRQIKNDSLIPNNSASRAAMYIGGMVLISSIAIGGFFGQNPSKQINNPAIANNIQDTSLTIAEADIPTSTMATKISDTPPDGSTNITAATIAAKQNHIENSDLHKNKAVKIADSQNAANKFDNVPVITVEEQTITQSIEKIDETTNDDALPSAGQSSSQTEIRAAQIPDSVKNDELDDIPVIVRKSDPLPEIDNIIETDRIEPRFGITDTPLQKPKTIPDGDGDLPTPITNIPTSDPRLPFPNN